MVELAALVPREVSFLSHVLVVEPVSTSPAHALNSGTVSYTDGEIAAWTSGLSGWAPWAS
jgi:hypothetical protein